MAEVSFYVVVAPVVGQYTKRVEGARAYKMTVNEPTGELPTGAVVTKVTLDVPLDLFMPLEVKAQIAPRPATITVAESPEDGTIRLAKELASEQ
jgi:hypothetical protein